MRFEVKWMMLQTSDCDADVVYKLSLTNFGEPSTNAAFRNATNSMLVSQNNAVAPVLASARHCTQSSIYLTDA